MKRSLSLLMSLLLCFSLAACGSTDAPADSNPTQEAAAPTVTDSQSAPDHTDSTVPTDLPLDDIDINVAVLKGPTAIGMVKLMADREAGTTKNAYNFTVAGTADQITSALISGSIPIAAIPCNLASTLYNKTDGKLVVAAVNTLGVLYLLETGNTVQSLADLKGKTIYTTGAGTTPEYTLRYLLTSAGIDPDKDVELVFLSEASEVSARLAAADEDMIAMLPQPYVTTVLMNNTRARIALSISEEWAAYNKDTEIVTGVIVVNRDFLQSHRGNVEAFLTEYAASTAFAVEQADKAAKLLDRYDIFPAAVAKKAIPYCSIVCLTGKEMYSAISGYLKILYEQNPASIGSSIPGDDFYYLP